MIGDHIRTLKDGRWTHAIDCGDETVIVLAEDAAQPPRVRRSYRPDFVAGADAVEVVLHRERTFPADEVVARAYSRISDPALASTFRDSEAFAEWCTTGRLSAAPQNVAHPVPGVAPAAPPGAAAPKPARRPASRKRPAARPRAARKAAKPAPGAARAKPARKAAKRVTRRGPAKRRPTAKKGRQPRPRRS